MQLSGKVLAQDVQGTGFNSPVPQKKKEKAFYYISINTKYDMF